MRLKQIFCVLLLFLLCILSGCTNGEGSGNDPIKTRSDSEDEIQEDSGFTAVIEDINIEDGKITFTNINTDISYTLDYSDDVKMQDKYGSVMSIAQFREGQIVEIGYDSLKSRLMSMKISKEAWEVTDIKKLDMDRVNQKVKILGNTYYFTKGLVVVKDGKTMSLDELCDQDLVTARGYKGRLCSVQIQTGHGYVRLVNYDTFIGGMVEIGKDVILPVTKDMLITVQAGEYNLQIDKDGRMGTQKIVVEENKETIANLQNLQIIACKQGILHFETTSPKNPLITVDGVDYKKKKDIKVDYGKHKIEISAVGYKSFNGTVELDSPYMTIYASLVKLDSDEKSTASTEEGKPTTQEPAEATTAVSPAETTTAVVAVTTEETTTQSAASQTTQTAAETKEKSTQAVKTTDKVEIEGPEGVNVYVDSKYIGKAPVKFTKVTGEHKITLTKEGYVPKVYTIVLEDDGSDSRFTFADLKKNES